MGSKSVSPLGSPRLLPCCLCSVLLASCYLPPHSLPLWGPCSQELLFNCTLPQRTKKIFVGGLAASVDEETFRAYFEDFGAVSTERQSVGAKQTAAMARWKLLAAALTNPSYYTLTHPACSFPASAQVEDAVVMYDHENKRPRGFGFITFAGEACSGRRHAVAAGNGGCEEQELATVGWSCVMGSCCACCLSLCAHQLTSPCSLPLLCRGGGC